MDTNKTTAIIILHGWASSSEAWKEHKQLLEEAGFQVFVPDLPGFGKEKIPQLPFSASDYADFVFNFANNNKLEKFNLIGLSFGGFIALKFATLHSERVNKMVVIGAAVPFLTFGKMMIKTYSVVCKIGNAIFFTKPFVFIRPLAKKVLFFLVRTTNYYPADNEIMQQTFKKVFSENLSPSLENLKVPTLIVWGKKDWWTPLEKGKILAAKIPDSKLVIIDGADHLLPYTKTKELLAEVTNFLSN